MDEHPHEPGERAQKMMARVERSRGIRPRDAAYLIVICWLIAVIVWGIVEHLLDKETFPTVWLGMWWALQTVTTVGYGDVVPQDTTGRMVASFLLLGGLAFLSVVTATITSGFVARLQNQHNAERQEQLRGQFSEMGERLARMERKLDQLGKG